jgi:hypothetical protein
MQKSKITKKDDYKVPKRYNPYSKPASLRRPRSNSTIAEKLENFRKRRRSKS